MSYPPGPPDNEEPAPEPGGSGPQPYGSPPPSDYASSGYGRPPQSPQYGYGQLPTTNVKATIALIVGISSLVLSFCCVGIAGVAAIVLGVKARNEISASGGRQTGDGMALAGIVTGAVAVLISLALVALFAILIATGNSDFDHGMYNAAG